jgi:hypothetical protein
LEARQMLASAAQLAVPDPGTITGDVRIPATDVRHQTAAKPGVAYTNYEILLSKTKGGVVTPLAGAGSPGGVSPAQMRNAYGVSNILFGNVAGDGTGQTIAIIDAYDNPSFVSSTDPNFAISDLHRFDVQFGLPDPPSFKKVTQTGGTSYPIYNSGWAGEIALDVEWAHAMAPMANIVLVEANDDFDTNLYPAITYARGLPGVSTVSMSWGGAETSGDIANNTTLFTTPAGHSGISFFASTGDTGTPAGYPSYSPNVVAVGGTALYFADSSGTWSTENVWNNSSFGTNNTSVSPGATGGGISTVESKPSYQNLVTTPSSTKRTAPDVALDADPYNGGASVLDSSGGGIGSAGGWWVYGGTSLSSPMWAGLGAVIDQGRVLEGLAPLDSGTQLLPKLYSISANDYHDVTSGNNRLARHGTFWSASAGYDNVTGRGTPKADSLVPNVAGIVLAGTVYNDTNQDGSLDNGESGIANVTVYLDANNNGSFDAGDTKATTNASGTYSFGEQLGGATYVVREILPGGGYTATSATSISTSAAWGNTGTNFGLALPLTTSFGGNSFTIRLDAAATQVQIFNSSTASGSPSTSIALSLLTSTPLTFTGTGLSDIFNVDLTNGNPIPSGGVTFTGSGNNSALRVTGSANADAVSVAPAAITVFGSSLVHYSNVAGIALNLNGGDDTATIDYSSGDPVPSAGIQVDGGSQSLGDQLVIIGTSGADAVSLASGTINFGGTISYTGIESLSLSTGNGDDTITADYSAGNPVPSNGIQVDGGGETSGDQLVITGSAAADIVNVASGAINICGTINYSNIESLALNTGGGDDIVTYAGPIAAAFAFHGGTGNDTLNVNSGALSFDHDVQSDTASLTLNVQSGAAVQFNSIQHITGLNLFDGSAATIASAGGNTLVLSLLSINGSGQLDINDNAVILNYADSSALTGVHTYLTTGRGAGPGAPATWLGPGGIISTVAHTIGNGSNVAVGYADNASLGAISAAGSYTAFAGQTVGSQSILIKMTRGADANLDGVVDGQDVSIIGTHFGKPDSGAWYLGDFDYSGSCDGSDVSVLGTTMNPNAPPL